MRERTLFSVAVCLLILACSRPRKDAQESGAAFDSHDPGELQKVCASGKLRFEIRDLNNEPRKQEYGAKQYRHTAVVVAVGEPQYTKGLYLLLCSIKRIAGGDPEYPRGEDDTSVIVIRDGIGRLEISGGYKTSSEKWQPERIEVQPIALFPAVSMVAQPVQEKFVQEK